MANLTYYQPADMLSTQVFFGTVEWALPTSIKVSRTYSDYVIYYGNFEYDASGNLSGGNVIRIARDRLFQDPVTRAYVEQDYFVDGFSVSATELQSYIDLGDLQGAMAYVLANSDTIVGSSYNDVLRGWNGNDTIRGGQGNDTLYGDAGNDVLNGGEGDDVAAYAAGQSTIVAALQSDDGNVTIITGFGRDVLTDIESVQFTDGTLTPAELVEQYKPPTYETSNGPVEASIYDGPVAFLQFEMLVTDANDVVTGSSANDFINLLGGDDAADGGAGQDVLDGGFGSNFLTGGAGADTFFLDGRAGVTTWSTITDFTEEDNVNIWGWQEGVSQLITTLENQGAPGYTGATFHYDLNGDGNIDTSLTFAQLSMSSIPDPLEQEIGGNGYILFT